jgi:hypothetical protein
MNASGLRVAPAVAASANGAGPAPSEEPGAVGAAGACGAARAGAGAVDAAAARPRLDAHEGFGLVLPLLAAALVGMSLAEWSLRRWGSPSEAPARPAARARWGLALVLLVCVAVAVAVAGSWWAGSAAGGAAPSAAATRQAPDVSTGQTAAGPRLDGLSDEVHRYVELLASCAVARDLAAMPAGNGFLQAGQAVDEARPKLAQWLGADAADALLAARREHSLRLARDKLLPFARACPSLVAELVAIR